jgi:hypothetical protein
VAKWRGRAPAHIEPPEWYRVYHPEQWDEIDAQERAMLGGWPGPPPADIHDCHSRRRWGEAKYAYRQAHPLLAEQEFQEILARAAKRRNSAT